VAPENSTSNLEDLRTLDPEISSISKGKHHRSIFKAAGGLAPKPGTSEFKLKIQELLEEDVTSKDASQVGESWPASNSKKSIPSRSPEKETKEKIKLRLERELTTEFLRTIDSDNPQIDQRAICEFPGQSAEHDFAGELKKKQMKIQAERLATDNGFQISEETENISCGESSLEIQQHKEGINSPKKGGTIPPRAPTPDRLSNFSLSPKKRSKKTHQTRQGH
jgi:hypothetical protein